MVSLYYSKWVFIDGLLPSLRTAKEAGEEAHVAAVHTAGHSVPIDLQDLGLEERLKRVRASSPHSSLFSSMYVFDPQGFALQPINTGLTFTHTFPGSVDTAVLCASPSLPLHITHYVRPHASDTRRDEHRGMWGMAGVGVVAGPFCFSLFLIFLLVYILIIFLLACFSFPYLPS
jgi:hypothetical protein